MQLWKSFLVLQLTVVAKVIDSKEEFFSHAIFFFAALRLALYVRSWSVSWWQYITQDSLNFLDTVFHRYWIKWHYFIFTSVSGLWRVVYMCTGHNGAPHRGFQIPLSMQAICSMGSYRMFGKVDGIVPYKLTNHWVPERFMFRDSLIKWHTLVKSTSCSGRVMGCYQKHARLIFSFMNDHRLCGSCFILTFSWRKRKSQEKKQQSINPKDAECRLTVTNIDDDLFFNFIHEC